MQNLSDRQLNKFSQLNMETTINPDGSITSKGSGILIGGELYKPGEKMSFKQRLSIQARIQMQGKDTVKPEMLKDFYDSGGPLSKEESAEYMKSENIEAGVFSPISDEDLKREQDLDKEGNIFSRIGNTCLLYTSPSPRDRTRSRMPSSA